ncbi:O-antigen ligase family protein [Phenylobacterium sp.]|uniref:O-antigen ligase family protein n=1 Tax=Phenylobacterium sp. TaxID=1871053 RepID=UPI002F419EE7
MAPRGISNGRLEGRSEVWSTPALVILAVMAPLLGWLAPQGLAALAALAGMATLPGLRAPRRSDWGLAAALAAGIAWIWASSAWGPYPLLARPWTGVTAAILAALGVSLIGAGRRAGPRTAMLFPGALVFGVTLLAVILLVEALSGAGLFRAINAALGTAVRPDLAIRDAARGTYGLIILGPAAIWACLRLGAARWLVPLLVGSLLFSAHTMDVAAPSVALLAAVLAAATVSLWPRMGPRALAAGSFALVLAMPLLIWMAIWSGRYDAMAARLPPSWAERMSYWRFAVERISEHPLRGWGLEASRDMAPGLILHPHNGALQLWLELGLPGAFLGAALCASVFLGLSRPGRDPGAVTGAATAAAYLTIGLVSFGIWQEWWVGLGLIAASFCAALRLPDPQAAPEPRQENPAVVAPPVSCVAERVMR